MTAFLAANEALDAPPPPPDGGASRRRTDALPYASCALPTCRDTPGHPYRDLPWGPWRAEPARPPERAHRAPHETF